MSRVSALALAVVLFHRLLEGAQADLGLPAAPGCAALLLLAAGAGLLSRARRPYLSEGVAFALLFPLRGVLLDLVRAPLPAGAAADALAALVSLGPVGFVLGRQVRHVGEAPPAALLAGLALGEVLVACGAAGWLPGWLAGAVAAAVLAALAETAAPRDGGAADAPPLARGLTALLLGAAAGLLFLVLPRTAAAYATPGVRWTQDSALVLLLPAALVAWPAAVLAGEGRGRRLLGLAGGLALAFAATRTLQHLVLHENAVAHVDLSRKLHDRALWLSSFLPAGAAHVLGGARAHLDAWAWLVTFAGLPVAALGLALGSRRGSELGWALVGAGFAAPAPWLLEARPADGLALLLLLGAACALAAAPVALFGLRGLWALPLAGLPFLDPGGDAPLAWRPLPGLAEVRRPGEYGVDAVERLPQADVLVPLVPARRVRTPEARRAHAESFGEPELAFGFDPDGAPRANFALATAHAFGADHGQAGDEHEIDPLVPLSAPPPEPELPSTRGLRVAGVPQHAQHPPLGPDGSIGRLLRLFAPAGPAFVTGLGAELLAADLHDAGLATSLDVASPVPLGRIPLRLLLEDLGSSGWQAARVDEPLAAARAAREGAWASVVVAPARLDLPGVAALATREHLARLRELLAPGGRCLLWLDTTWMPRAALAARLAAFGAAFGERSAAFVEPRELDAPLVLCVGWRDDAGAPGVTGLRERLPPAGRSGRRVPLPEPDALSALLVRDGPGLVALADDVAAHARARPVQGALFGSGGWAALAPLCDPGARLSRAVAGARDGPPPPADVLAGLSLHAGYDYELEGLNSMLLEIRADVDWARWGEEVAAYERAARAAPGHPLLAHALTALLEPLAVVGDFGRFAEAFTRCAGETLPSWRLALQEWWVQSQSLESQAAEAAAERARRLAGVAVAGPP